MEIKMTRKEFESTRKIVTNIGYEPLSNGFNALFEGKAHGCDYRVDGDNLIIHISEENTSKASEIFEKHSAASGSTIRGGITALPKILALLNGVATDFKTAFKK